MGDFFLLIGSIVAGAADRDITRFPKDLQPFGESAVTYTEILSAATDTSSL